MSISDKRIQQQFQEVLLNMYTKGQESERLEAIDFINEIKQQMMSVMNRSEYMSIGKRDS